MSEQIPLHDLSFDQRVDREPEQSGTAQQLQGSHGLPDGQAQPQFH